MNPGLTDNGRRILRAWLVMVAVSMVLVTILAILAAEPDPATRGGITTTVESMGVAA